MGEALAIADRHAREEVRVRAEMQSKLAAKEKKEKEDKLRMLAQRAREERSGLAPSASVAAGDKTNGGGVGGAPIVDYNDSDDEEEEDEETTEEKIRERDEIRKERMRQREREIRMSHMGADTKARLKSTL